MILCVHAEIMWMLVLVVMSSVASNLEFIKSIAACSVASDASYSKLWQLPMFLKSVVI